MHLKYTHTYNKKKSLNVGYFIHMYIFEREIIIKKNTEGVIQVARIQLQYMHFRNKHDKVNLVKVVRFYCNIILT